MACRSLVHCFESSLIVHVIRVRAPTYPHRGYQLQPVECKQKRSGVPARLQIGDYWEDRNKAKALAELFQQQDWSVWWDRNILHGRSFDEVIEEALRVAKCVVVLWSKNSASSDWVKGEAAEALRRKFSFWPALTSRKENIEDFHSSASSICLRWFLESRQ